MQHCLSYLLLYGTLLGLLAACYANYQMFEEHSTLMHVTAALTAGRPVFGFLGWLVRSRLPYEEGAGSHLPYKEGLSARAVYQRRP